MKVLDIPDNTTANSVLTVLAREIDVHGTVCFTRGKEILFFALSNSRFDEALRKQLEAIGPDISSSKGN